MLFAAHGACAFALSTATMQITERVANEAARAREWRYVWTAINGLSTVGPLAAIPFTSRDIRADLVAGSVSSAISTGFTFFWPLEVEGAPDKLALALELAPCQRLPSVLAIAASAAEDEIARRAWPWHLLNFGVSAALGTVVAFGFHHPTGGVISGVSGFAVGEAQLFTQPVGLSRDPLLLVSVPRLGPLWWASAAGEMNVVGVVLEGRLP